MPTKRFEIEGKKYRLTRTSKIKSAEKWEDEQIKVVTVRCFFFRFIVFWKKKNAS